LSKAHNVFPKPIDFTLTGKRTGSPHRGSLHRHELQQYRKKAPRMAWHGVLPQIISPMLRGMLTGRTMKARYGWKMAHGNAWNDRHPQPVLQMLIVPGRRNSQQGSRMSIAVRRLPIGNRKPRSGDHNNGMIRTGRSHQERRVHLMRYSRAANVVLKGSGSSGTVHQG